MSRIGYLVSQYPAPSHTFIHREIDALRRTGLEIETFSVRRPSAAESFVPEARAEIDRTFYILPVSLATLAIAHLRALVCRPRRYFHLFRLALGHRVPGARALLWSLFYFAEAIRLAGELVRRRIVHLHSHFGNVGATVGLLAAKYVGIGWSVSIHGISEFDYPAGLLLAKKLAAAEFAACASNFVKAEAMRKIDPADWSKLFLSRCGLDLTTPANPPRPVESAPSHPPVILFVGRLAPEKGCRGIVEAFEKLVRTGVAAQLRIVGDGPDSEVLRERIRAAGIEDRCVLLGQLDESATLAEIARADVLVNSSLMEGLPVTLIEALWLGTPVVAPQLAGIPELIENGVSGLLYSPGCWDQLAECLARILSDGDLRSRIQGDGRQRIGRDYDISRTVEPLRLRFAEKMSVTTEVSAESAVVQQSRVGSSRR